MEFIFRRSYRGPVQALIVDWAGTIVDYGCYAPAMVFVQVFAERGVELSLSQARIPMGTEKKEHIRQLLALEEVAEGWREAHGHAPTENDIEALYQAFIPQQIACLADYANLIPGTREILAELRGGGIKIGSSTGYNRAMLEVLLKEAAARGLSIESNVSASEVPAGRPAPWMCFPNAQQLGVYPMAACVKVGDTVPDIEEGLNAGMWTVGVAKTGNEMGLLPEVIAALSPEDYQKRLAAARARLGMAGAHYVVESITDLGPVVAEIGARLRAGEGP
jgi:phosphonoacetaldehyde hydrolase